jgi:hypothetical protein
MNKWNYINAKLERGQLGVRRVDKMLILGPKMDRG